LKENINVALVQFSPWPMKEMQKNVQFIIGKIKELTAKGKELIAFPEMSVTNFFEHEPKGKENYWKNGAISIDDPAITQIVEVVKEKNCYVVVGFAERSELIGKIYNSALLIGPEGIIGITRKLHFPGLEKLYFSPGSEIPVFDTPIGKIGISICYDSMFTEYLRVLAVKGAEIVVMTSSIWKGGDKGGIGSEESKEKFWDQLPVTEAVTNQVFVVACNGGGTHMIGKEIGTWERLGLSKIVSPMGEILAKLGGNDENLLHAELKKDLLEEARSVYTFLSDRVPHMYKDLV
jgi:predicted amidohydrolase